MAHDVFISYAMEDKPIADAICATLESRKIRCWIAPRDIIPGQNYPSAIIHAINESKIIIVVFSSKANQSPHIMSEVQRAFNNEIVIIPFRIENVEPSESMQYFLSTPHWLDALNPPLEQHLNYLAETISILLSQRKKEPSEPKREPEPAAVEGKIAAPLPSPPPSPTPPQEPVPQSEPQRNYAGIGRRTIAYLLDVLRVSLIWLTLVVVIFILLYATGSRTPALLTMAFGSLIYLLYFYLREVSPRQLTYGKSLMKIQIVSENGGPLPMEKRQIRWALKHSPFIFMLLYFIVDDFSPNSGLASVVMGVFLILALVFLFNAAAIPISGKKQTLYDMYVGSLVVRIG
jgi:uncharacterized RDD family membrane protein YckC